MGDEPERRAAAPGTPAEIRRRIARREATLWLSAFGWPALRVVALGAALGVVVVVLAPDLVTPYLDAGDDESLLRAGIGYGALFGTLPAVWAGLSSLALRLARGWAVIPALTLPVYVAVAGWLRRDVLRADLDALQEAVNRRLDVGGLDTLHQIAGAQAPTTSDVPRMAASASDALLDGPVRQALEALEGDVGTTLLVSVVPGVLVSVVALAIGFRRGWAQRHEADLERLRASS